MKKLFASMMVAVVLLSGCSKPDDGGKQNAPHSKVQNKNEKNDGGLFSY